MDRVNLFSSENERIKITVEAYFKNSELVIDGYDIGKSVDEAWGDSDHVYITSVSVKEVPLLYPILEVEKGNREALLEKIAETFNSNTAFSDFNAFLKKHQIAYKGQSSY